MDWILLFATKGGSQSIRSRLTSDAVLFSILPWMKELDSGTRPCVNADFADFQIHGIRKEKVMQMERNSRNCHISVDIAE